MKKNQQRNCHNWKRKRSVHLSLPVSCLWAKNFWNIKKESFNSLSSILALRKSFSCLRAIAKAGFLCSRRALFVLVSLMLHRLPSWESQRGWLTLLGFPRTEGFPRMKVFQGPKAGRPLAQWEQFGLPRASQPSQTLHIYQQLWDSSVPWQVHNIQMWWPRVLSAIQSQNFLLYGPMDHTDGVFVGLRK